MRMMLIMSGMKCSTPYMMLLHRPRSTAVRRPCCIRRSTTACERCISLLLSLIWGMQALKYWQGWRWWTVSASICSPSIVTSLHSSWLAPWLTMWKGLQAACVLLPSHAVFSSIFPALITSKERLLLIYLLQYNFHLEISWVELVCRIQVVCTDQPRWI